MLIQAIIFLIFILLSVIVVVYQLNLIESYNQVQVGTNIQNIPFDLPSRYNDYSAKDSTEESFDYYVRIINMFIW